MVGNLLYYRFLNPAVVAPDAFDVVTLAAGGVLAAPQRHTLGAVAQLLQHAAAGKAFPGDGPHLRVLNGYVEDTHLKFRSGPALSPHRPCTGSCEEERHRVGRGLEGGLLERRQMKGLEGTLGARRGGTEGREPRRVTEGSSGPWRGRRTG